MKIKNKAAFIVALILLDLSIVCRAQGKQELRFIAAGIFNARHNLTCMQVNVGYYNFVPKDNPLLILDGGTQAQETKIKSQIAYKEPYLSIAIQNEENDVEKLIKSFHLSSDGRVAKSLTNYSNFDSKQVEKLYSRGIIAASGNLLKNGLWTNHQTLDPRFYAYFSGYEPLDQVFLNDKYSPIYLGEELLHGSRCMKVQVQSSKDEKSIFWIDTEHMFVVRREESISIWEGEELIRAEVDVPQLQEGNGFWIPALVNLKLFSWGTIVDPTRVAQREGITIKGKFAATSPTIRKLVFSDFKSNCDLDPTVFDFSWPVKTQITNNFTQSVLVADVVTEQEFSALNELRKAKELPALSPSTPTQKELDSFNSSRKQLGQVEVKTAYVVILGEDDRAALKKLRL